MATVLAYDPPPPSGHPADEWKPVKEHYLPKTTARKAMVYARKVIKGGAASVALYSGNTLAARWNKSTRKWRDKSGKVITAKQAEKLAGGKT